MTKIITQSLVITEAHVFLPHRTIYIRACELWKVGEKMEHKHLSEMPFAELDSAQLHQLKQMEQELNIQGDQEVYLIAFHKKQEE
nr:hypothetical protein [Brevibacillus laterosporus]